MRGFEALVTMAIGILFFFWFVRETFLRWELRDRAIAVLAAVVAGAWLGIVLHCLKELVGAA